MRRSSSAAERSVAGEGALVVVEAAAGMGKSRLLEAGGHAADERGLALLRAREGELERDFAYGVVRQQHRSAIGQVRDQPVETVGQGE